MSAVSVRQLLTSLGYASDGVPGGGAIPHAAAIGFYRPSLPHRIQVLARAADHSRVGHPWPGRPPQLIVIGSDAQASDWSAPAAALDLAIRIEHAEVHWQAQDRLHGRRQMLDIFAVAVPGILLPARLGHNAVMVEAACRDHRLRLNGYVVSEAFAATHDRHLGDLPQTKG